MDKVRILGGIPLNGEVEVSGSKNAALPILISSLLAEGDSQFENIPKLMDIHSTLKLLDHMGAEIDRDMGKGRVRILASDQIEKEAPYDLVRKMRASVLVLGPLLARFGKAKVSLPGGCAIGARPIQFHLAGLERLGARIELEGGYILASARKLHGNRVTFEFPSVGATENLLMAAARIEGESVLENCAKEPEIIDLANVLRKMGARIEGDGTEKIHIQGVASLRGCDHRVMGDRIEGSTYLAAAFATGGRVKVVGMNPSWVESVLAQFEECGAEVNRMGDEKEPREVSVELIAENRPLSKDMTTAPFPGFPTDMQAQFMAVMAVAKGTSVITENIFENRFMHVSELARLGADISVKGKIAVVRGVDQLVGAPLMATDLRASASLIIGGLCAQGETVVSRIYHLDRGYECLEEKLARLGARIERLTPPSD